MTQFTIPGLTDKQAARLTELLQRQLSTYNDLHLTLKHIHWNVVGPNFIGVHEMLDPQVEAVRDFAADRNQHSQRFYRIINEIPAVLMIGIVILAVVKPF